MKDETVQDPYIAATEELIEGLDRLSSTIDEQLGGGALSISRTIDDAETELDEARKDIEEMAGEANAEIDDAVLALISDEEAE